MGDPPRVTSHPDQHSRRRALQRIGLGALTFGAATLAGSGRSAHAGWREWVRGIYPYDEVAPKLSLTFDDVPRRNFAPFVLDLLAEHDLKATFFVEGDLVRVLPHVVRRMVKEGHSLGNHTWSHAALSRLKARQIHRQLDRTQQAVDDALGFHHRLRLVRPPFGAPWIGSWPASDRRRVGHILRDRGEFVVLWQGQTDDTRRGCTSKAVQARVIAALERRRAGVLVFHPTDCARRALPAICRAIGETETEVVGIEALIEAKYGAPLQQLVASASVDR